MILGTYPKIGSKLYENIYILYPMMEFARMSMDIHVLKEKKDRIKKEKQN